ncbi:10813_t:CDS:2, partial [Entrophospora sp. SA101]
LVRDLELFFFIDDFITEASISCDSSAEKLACLRSYSDNWVALDR